MDWRRILQIVEKEKKEKEEKEKKDKEKKGDLLADIVLPIKEFWDKDEDKNEDEANAAKTRWRCGPHPSCSV